MSTPITEPASSSLTSSHTPTPPVGSHHSPPLNPPPSLNLGSPSLYATLTSPEASALASPRSSVQFQAPAAPPRPPPPPPPQVPKLKIANTDSLHLGDCMKIVGLHERGFRAQILNGKGEVLLVSSPSTSDDRVPPPAPITSSSSGSASSLMSATTAAPSPRTRSSSTSSSSPSAVRGPLSSSAHLLHSTSFNSFSFSNSNASSSGASSFATLSASTSQNLPPPSTTSSSASPRPMIPPSSSRSLSPTGSRCSSPSLRSTHQSRSQSQPSPSRSMSALSPRTAQKVVNTLHLALSLPQFSVPESSDDMPPHGSPPVQSRSTPVSPATSPRASVPFVITRETLAMSPPAPPKNPPPPRQKRTLRKSKKAPNVFYPLQGWVLWRKTIGQWERIWLCSKKSPTRLCFYSSENEDKEEAESILASEIQSIWAPQEDNKPKLVTPSPVHFRVFASKRTAYLIVKTPDKMWYWIKGMQKLNPLIELDLKVEVVPFSKSRSVDTGGESSSSPLSPRSTPALERYLMASPTLPAGGYTSDEESELEEDEDWNGDELMPKPDRFG